MGTPPGTRGVAGAAALSLHPLRTASLGASISPRPHLLSSSSPACSSGVHDRRSGREIVASLHGWGCCGYLSKVSRNQRLKQRRCAWTQMCMDQWIIMIINNQHLSTVVNWSSRECTFLPKYPCWFLKPMPSGRSKINNLDLRVFCTSLHKMLVSLLKKQQNKTYSYQRR